MKNDIKGEKTRGNHWVIGPGETFRGVQSFLRPICDITRQPVASELQIVAKIGRFEDRHLRFNIIHLLALVYIR